MRFVLVQYIVDPSFDKLLRPERSRMLEWRAFGSSSDSTLDSIVQLERGFVVVVVELGRLVALGMERTTHPDTSADWGFVAAFHWENFH